MKEVMSLRRSSKKEENHIISTPNDRFKEVLLVGVENDRLKKAGGPSKAVGLMGGVQRPSNDVNDSLVESFASFKMQAGFMKQTESGNVVFKRATSFEGATGVHIGIAAGCYYASTQSIDERKKNLITKAAVKQLSLIASDIFLTPMRRDLGWYEAAEVMQTELIENSRIDSLQVIDTYQGTTLVKQCIVNCMKYVPFGSFDMEREGDERYAWMMTNEFSKVSKSIINAVVESEYTFGTVCSRGQEIQLSLDQIAQDFIQRGETEELDEVADLFSRM